MKPGPFGQDVPELNQHVFWACCIYGGFSQQTKPPFVDDFSPTATPLSPNEVVAIHWMHSSRMFQIGTELGIPPMFTGIPQKMPSWLVVKQPL